jgi:hypothetical protein
VRLLLECTAVPNSRSRVSGRTLLVYVATSGRLAAVRAFLNGAANIASCDFSGVTAVDYAVSGGHAEIVRLLEHGAGALTRDLPRGYAALADVARRADAVRPVTRTCCVGEAEDVVHLLDGMDQRMNDVCYTKRMLHVQKVRSFRV